MKYLFLILALIFAWLIATNGHAATRVNIAIIGANGPGAFSKAGVQRLYYRAKPKLRKIGLATHLLSLRYQAQPLPTYGNRGQTDIYYGPEASMFAYWRYISKDGHRRRNTAYMIVLPPIIYQGQMWLAGINSKRCGYKDGGMSIVNAKNTADRQVHSVYAFLHELGHDLGAEHVSSRTVMNYGVLSMVGERPGWDDESVSQIYDCLQ